ncbi:thiolase family protein [Nocardia bovistercoris]|uniref:Thiolase family protein n=1 Tax=Nocardia bovistercoris TaxID=2785916 RepID=A0A931N5E9_9NOCA|nr:thiolase family protein [Nocardia bovistercoris]MBH0779764.1 thiolase family protein [Nocardia bovistercoris]
MSDVAIIGVGLHPFGRFPGKPALEMGAYAARMALADAGVSWPDVEFAVGGSFEVDQPDAVVAQLGVTGVPFTNVYNGCATAGSALAVASQTIKLGEQRLGLVVGLDKHEGGAFTSDPTDYGCPAWYGELGLFLTTKFFGMKINRYMHDHAITPETLAAVAAKNYRNGVLNPNAHRRKPLSVEEILGSRMINHPLTQYMFCSPDEGAAAAVVCDASVAHKYTDNPIYLRSVVTRTRRYGAYEVHTPATSTDNIPAPTVDAARAAFEIAGIGPEDVRIAQLQDTDAGAEVIHMAEVGLCADGEQNDLIARGVTDLHGELPVNTDGGLIANGEPVGASGLRQVYELVTQMRGRAGDRQVDGTPSVGLAQLYGAPGVAAVSILSR